MHPFHHAKSGVWVFACLVLCLLVPLKLKAAATVISAPINPVAYWKFDEGSGSYAYDSSGNNLTSNANAGFTWPAGYKGTGIDYTANGNYVFSYPHYNGLNFGTGNFTLSMWGRFRSFVYPRAWFMADKSQNYDCQSASSAAGWELGHSYNPEGIFFCMSDGANRTGNVAVAFAPGSRPADLLNTWVHLAVVVDRTAGRVRFYVNGVLQPNELDISAVTGSISSTGSFNLAGLHGWRTDGTIDEVRVYNKALSKMEIGGMVALTAGDKTGQVGAWTLDDGSGTIATDFSGSGNNAVLFNITPASDWVAGKRGTALQLNGSNAYVNLPSLFTNFSSGLTICAWTYFSNNSNWQRILDLGNGSASDNILFARNGTSANLAYQVYSGPVAGATVQAAVIEQNTWMHLCATENAAGSVVLYKNGASVATGSTSVPAVVNRGSNFLGRSNWGGDGYFGGKLDEVNLYNRPLSASEISALYTKNTTKVNAPQNSRSTGNLVANWSFNGPDISGSTAYDRAGSNHATLYGATPAIGKVGQALECNGSTYVSAATTGSSLFGSSPSSLSAWIYLPAAPSVWQGIITQGREGLAWWGLWLASNSTWIWGRYNSNLGGLTATPGWTHLVITDDLTSVYMYVNGVGTYIGSHLAQGNTAPLYLGKTGVGENFTGRLDEVRLYTKALSAAEARQLYLLGK